MSELGPVDWTSVAEGDVIGVEGRGTFKVTEVRRNEDGTMSLAAVVYPPLDDGFYTLYQHPE